MIYCHSLRCEHKGKAFKNLLCKTKECNIVICSLCSHRCEVCQYYYCTVCTTDTKCRSCRKAIFNSRTL